MKRKGPTQSDNMRAEYTFDYTSFVKCEAFPRLNEMRATRDERQNNNGDRHRSEAEPVLVYARKPIWRERIGRVSGLEFCAGDAALPDDRK